MAKYDLTGSLETSFTFSIGDKEFKFKKPTVREMRALSKKFASVDPDASQEEQVAASDMAMAELYEYVEPINHDSVLKDLMEDQPVGVQFAFNEMIKKELGAS